MKMEQKMQKITGKSKWATTKKVDKRTSNFYFPLVFTVRIAIHYLKFVHLMGSDFLRLCVVLRAPYVEHCCVDAAE